MAPSQAQQCVSCGSPQVNWRLHRTGTRQLRHSLRQIHWVCRQCAHEWADPIGAELEDPLPPA